VAVLAEKAVAVGLDERSEPNHCGVPQVMGG
jgi:hypothetical protein